MSIGLYELAIRFKSEGFKTVSRDMDGLDKKGKGLAKSFAALKTALAIGAIGAAGGFLSKVVKETIDAQKETAQLNAVLKSTGMVAGVTSGEIDKLAQSLQSNSTFSDGAVKSAAALLLTFTNIRGEVFRNTLPAITDLATAMGTDLNQATIQVGKALNDPIKGVSALQRVGVSFSQSQKDVIKSLVETNRLADAQGIILKELGVQFGGSALAARNTLGGALTHLGNKWDELFEVTGKSSQGITDAVNTLADSLNGLRDRFNELALGVRATFDVLRTFADLAIAAHFAIVTIFNPQSWRSNFEQLNAALGRIKDRLTGMNRAFDDVTSGSSTSAPPKKIVPPPGGTGTGTGKDKGPKIPNFNMPDFALPSTIFDASPFDLEGASQWGMTPEQLEEMFAEHKKNREEFTRKAQELEEIEAAKFRALLSDVGATLGDAVYNAFAVAFDGGSIGGIFKEFGKTILAGLGNIITQQGQALLTYGITMQAAAWGLTNPFTAGPAAIAAGAALIALGSAFGAIASGGKGTGRGTAQAGAFRERNTDIVRLKFVDRPGMASSLSPAQPMVFNIIGPNDAAAQRAIGSIVQKYSRRQS